MESISELTVLSTTPCKQNTFGCHACSVRCSSGNQDNGFLEDIAPTYQRRIVLVLGSPQTQLPSSPAPKLHTSPFFVNAMVKSGPHATAMVCARDADGRGGALLRKTMNLGRERSSIEMYALYYRFVSSICTAVIHIRRTMMKSSKTFTN